MFKVVVETTGSYVTLAVSGFDDETEVMQCIRSGEVIYDDDCCGFSFTPKHIVSIGVLEVNE